MNKADLITKVAKLNAILKANESEQTKLNSDLLEAQKQLESINKPVITRQTLNKMQELVQDTLDNYNFNRVDEYEYEFNINYDNRLELDHIEFNNVDEIAEQISIELEELFNIEGDND